MSDRQDDDIEDEIIIEQEGDESESEPEEKVSKAEADDSDEGELESYSKGVQKRISRLTEKVSEGRARPPRGRSPCTATVAGKAATRGAPQAA
jgi:hypothetical protein